MGAKVISDRSVLVSFEPRDGSFVAFMAMEGVFSIEKDPDIVLRKAAKLYQLYISTMQSQVADIYVYRKTRTPTPARKIWELGNTIFQLKEELRESSVEIDGLYEHLVRDLSAKRKWLEKVVIFRRYIPEEKSIPESLNWGRCEKGTRKIAERLREGLPIDKKVLSISRHDNLQR